MIQPIYSSVSNAKITPCNQKLVIKSEPIPLLKENFLNEFRTAVEKAKVRQNLGIADSETLQWGNILGFIEKQSDLVDFITQQFSYTNSVSEKIIDVKTALNYALEFINTYTDNNEAISEIVQSFETINQQLESLEENTKTNKESINEIIQQISDIDDAISTINETLNSLDESINNWIKTKLESSKTINLDFEVKISKKENNAINLEDDGLYASDTYYHTQLSNTTVAPNTIGGISAGTPVSQLKGKSMIEIIDAIVFPIITRDLVYPTLKYDKPDQLVEVGLPIINEVAIYTQNDAGVELSRNETITKNNLPITTDIYTLGDYLYEATVHYEAGPYLIDNKGEVTSKRVEAGTLNASFTISATYPWYVDNIKQSLIKFDTASGLKEFISTGNTIIKLPGINSKINSLKVNGGLGFLDVNLEGWEKSTEELNGITYQVWTKTDPYTSNLPHQIQFKLSL